MKKCLYIILIFSLSSMTHHTRAQAGANLEEGYYVTIGVYAKSKEGYAKKYTKKAQSMGVEADYGFSMRKNYYYVYTFFSQNYKQAIDNMRTTRKAPEFSEAWVYVHMKSLDQKSSEVEKKEIPESTETASEKVQLNNREENNMPVDETLEGSEAEVEKEDEGESEMKPTRVTPVYFNVVNARTGKPIEGEVQLIDTERAKLLEVAEAGDTTLIADPDNRTGNMAFIVDAFGYKKTQLDFNFYNPDISLPYISKLGDDTYEVDMEMLRYRKGDFATMYNVYFYKDAALMLPESKYELNNLLTMMEENPKYVIRIHGHTNGNSAGKIITLGDSDNLFALTDGNKEGVSTAKKLSKERAEIVKKYLVQHGIDGKRMQVKGWGGKRPVREKLGAMARQNVRVEIEILKD